MRALVRTHERTASAGLMCLCLFVHLVSCCSLCVLCACVFSEGRSLQKGHSKSTSTPAAAAASFWQHQRAHPDHPPRTMTFRRILPLRTCVIMTFRSRCTMSLIPLSPPPLESSRPSAAKCAPAGAGAGRHCDDAIARADKPALGPTHCGEHESHDDVAAAAVAAVAAAAIAC